MHGRPDNPPLLWTGPRRVDSLFYFKRSLARRVARHRTSSVIPLALWLTRSSYSSRFPPWSRCSSAPKPTRASRLPSPRSSRSVTVVPAWHCLQKSQPLPRSPAAMTTLTPTIVGPSGSKPESS